MKIRLKYDLLLMNVVALVTVVVLIFLPDNILRIILALPFALFIPGYLVIVALFPDWRSIGYIDRAGLSLAMSIAIVPSIGFILNYTPWHITFSSVLISLVIFIFIMSVAALIRRHGIPADSFPDIRFPPAGWGKTGNLDKLINVTLVVLILAAFGSLAYVSFTPKKSASHTEFYILGLPERKMENYPTVIKLGSSADIVLGIVNHEHKTVNYTVRIYIDGTESSVVGPLDIEDEQVWEDNVSIVPTKVGKEQRVEFVLYSTDEGEPLDRLWFWADVE